MSNAVRFVADAMLGKLARWLRILGYDTLYNPAWDDLELARIARAEDRVLLTRDTPLAERRGVQTLFVQSEKPLEQLGQVFSALGLHSASAYSRCSVCNAPLQTVSREALKDRLPEFVLANQHSFRECPHCGRVYWQGTHWQGMQEILNGLNGENSP
jgi:hypothetical protein